MGKHSTITARQISDNELVNKIEDAASSALVNQPWWARRKNSLTAVANIILQAANLILFAVTGLPIGVTIAIAIVISLAEVVIHASTKAPVTPAVAATIAAEAEKIEESSSGAVYPGSE